MANQRWNRRQFVQAGGAGLFGLSLPRLLLADPQRQNASADACIFIVVSGGLSHLDSIDPKPAAPAEIRGPYKTIETSVPGIRVCERMPQLAAVMDRACLVRTFSHKEIPHVSAAHMLLTGQSDGSRNDKTPFIGSIISRMRPADAVVPSYVWLHNMKTGTNKIPRYNNGLNQIGIAHAPLRVGYELDNPTNPEFRVRAFDPADGVSLEQISRRFHLLDELEPPASPILKSEAGDFRTFQQHARQLVTRPDARRAFDVSREPDKVRHRYGRHPIGQYLLMARRLIESGVRIATVTAWPGLAPGETDPTVTQVWDMHGTRYKNGDNMYGNGPFGLRWSLPRLDQGVSALIEDLDQRGMLKRTLVVLLSEFGRTPRFENSNKGRGHWPHCYSGLMAGGGIRGGAVYGRSDEQGAYVASGQPIRPEDLGATIFQALGIPPETRFGPDGFSLRVSEGQPVHELFG